MDVLLTAALWVLFLFLLPSVTYLLVLAIGGIRVKPLPPSGRNYRFTVLVPVHNEESVVEALISSIRACHAQGGGPRIVFVADHCTDATVPILRKQAVEVLENAGPERGKAAAVALGVRHIVRDLDDRSDLLVVLDADNRLDSKFFAEVAAGMNDGIDVAQGNTGYTNWDATVFTRLNHLNILVTNRFKDLARSQLGLSSVLRGHGMILRPAVVRRLSWSSETLAEDREMLAELVLVGMRVVWIYRARLSSVIPDNIAAAANQRRRWAGGKRDVSRRVVGPLLKFGVAKRNKVALDLAVNYLMPSYANLLGLIIVGYLAAAFALGVAAPLAWLFLGLLALFLGYYYLASRLEGVPLRVFAVFLVSPFFIFWRLWIYFTSLKTVTKWS